MDIENSQVALIEKLAVVQLDLGRIFRIKRRLILLLRLIQHASNNLDLIKKATEKI